MSEGGSPAGRSPPFWLAAGHLAALWAVAVALPVFDLLGKNPTFFVAHGAGAAEILLVCALVVAAVPAALVLVLAGFRMVSRPAADVYLAVMVGVLAALLLGSLFDSLLGPLLVPIAAVAGTVAGLGYHRGTSIRTALTVLVPVPLVLTAWFLFLTPTRTLVFPPSVSAASVTLEDEPPPIFVIVFDEMPVASLLDRDLAIDAERYPNLARLAGDGTFYRNATGVGAFSNEAIPAILTGKLVTESGIPPTAGGHPENLFTLLASAYRVVATEPVTGLCSDSICEKSPSGPRDLPIDVLLTDLAVVAGHSALPEVLVDALPSLEGSWSYFGRSRPAPERFAGEEPRTEGAPEFADPSAVAIGQWDLDIAEIDVADEPTLRFIHTVFPHFPWNRHADGRAYLSLDAHGLLLGAWTSEYGSDIGLQRHLLQTQYADQLFGEFLERLDALGLYDDSLIVVTSDHGASFDRSLRVPEGATDEAGVMGVPLLVKLPGEVGVGRVDDRPAQTIDVVPTIADAVGAPVPWELDGRSLLGPAAGADRRRAMYDDGRELAAIDGGRLERLDDVVDRIYDLFEGPDGDLVLYGVEGHGDLVGRLAAELPGVLFTAEGCWSPGLLPDPGDDFQTGWVHGSLEERSEEAPVPYAVVVDGTIAGTAATFRERVDGQLVPHRIYAIADPDAWGGEGDITLYEILDDEEPVLAPIVECAPGGEDLEAQDDGGNGS